jgi:DNA-binding transcriptional regulator GbsR (MarR family)
MTFEEAKQTFIETWGTMSSSWGINKSMAQIHALLLASRKPLNTDDIMLELSVSRGNVSMSLKSLQEWDLIYKTHLKKDRKDYYIAEKDMWLVATRIMAERRRQEIETMLKAIKPLRSIEDRHAAPKELQEFNNVITNVYSIAKTSNRFLKAVGSHKKLKVIKTLNKLGKKG